MVREEEKMKEQFREKVPKGQIRIQIQDKKDDPVEYWETTAETLLLQIQEVVHYHASIKIKLTNRQLYYKLVGKNWIPNRTKVYKRVCKFLTDIRYCGLVDWDAIEDKEREAEKHTEWDNPLDALQTLTRVYRLPRWSDQEYYVEMYCEKKAGINTLEPVAEKYHIHFGFNRGYSSASAIYELAKRLKEQIEDGKKAIILYFGDHDASGLDMIRDIEKRIEEFLTMGQEYTDPEFEIIPVSLTMEQIEKYDPPPNPAKQSDPRAKWYIAQFGNESWELESLDALELRKIAQKSILEYLDIDKYNAWIEKERKEKQALRKVAKKLSEDE
jgi:hypothetical protein